MKHLPRIAAAHVAAVLALFAPVLFGGEVLYFRDISVTYFPNYVFLERSLSQGVWPLWNPACDGGAPFLVAYPLDLVLVFLLGAKGTLALGPPLHVLIAMLGASVLASRLDSRPVGAWLAGAIYGMSGFVLSSVNLLPLLHGAAWAPWILAAAEALAASPSLRRSALLAVLLALQVSSLAGEIVVQTAVAALFLLPRPSRRFCWHGLIGLLLAALMAAPALAGLATLVQGSRRATGFTQEEALAFSASAPVILEALLPRFFGDVHSASDAGFWGQAFFPAGYPYLLSLYIGPGALVLALRGGLHRLWWLAALGVLLALGEHGPLAWLLVLWGHLFRAPVKFLLLTTLALSLLAGRGLGRPQRAVLPLSVLALVPGAVLLLAGASIHFLPSLVLAPLVAWAPSLGSATALHVVQGSWPAAFAGAGAAALMAGLAFRTGGWMPTVAAVAVAADLAVVNGVLNAAAPPDFYELRPQVKRLVERARGDQRVFSYGLGNSSSVHWRPRREASDVVLYGLDRQALLPRAHVLDGLEGALDEDRTGFAPAGATLAPALRTPGRFREIFPRIVGAGVRWVLSFDPLPEDLVAEADRAQLAEAVEPLRLYEVRGALSRAFGVARSDGAPPPAVAFRRLDVHTIELAVSGPPGDVVVLEGFDSGWRAESDGRAVPLRREKGRYWALAFPGGNAVITARYAPAWKGPTLVVSVLGLLAALGLLVRRSP